MLGSVVARGRSSLQQSPGLPPQLAARDRVWICYLADSGFWQERVLLLRLGGSDQFSRWATLSPDLEHLDEELSDPAVLDVVRSLPAEVSAEDRLGFEDVLGRDITALEVSQQIREARRISGLEATGLPARLGADAASASQDEEPSAGAVPSHSDMLTAPRAPGSMPVPSADVGLIASALAAAGGPAAPEHMWVIAHSAHGFLAGELVPSGARCTKGTYRGIMCAAEGKEVFVCTKAVFDESGQMKVERAGMGTAALTSETARPEARVLPLQHNLHGERYRSFQESLLHMTGDVAGQPDNPIAGPSTLTWLMRHMLGNGGTPTSFHERWMSNCKLDYTASGTKEHSSLCKMLEIILTVDQLDASKLVAMEVLSRKLQMIHDRWKHKMPQLASGVREDDDSHLLLGLHETRGNIGIAPTLSKWLGEELSKEAAVSKERRKAREERSSAVPKK